MNLTHPSPNFGERRGRGRVELVVLHYTAMPSCAAALDRLCDPAAEVSAHYLIDGDGTVLSLVEEAARAWHAGAGEWSGADDVNSRSIGIELANTGRDPFAEPQMTALERLLAGILDRHALPPKAVIGHSDMAPDRKGDPGPRFDWRRLALQGLSVWPELAEPGDFRADLRAFGYPDTAPETLLSAFRLRFRPWACGPVDDTDRALAAGLRRFAVDGTPADA
ncbi:MAG: N-acetylmuramoyl-L-alanine amidase [Tabrizicola sp.]|uniref:N-acetylmuramoyl-L-alanine amidase n=1 Tax=Tabrizicola sp. TaxID=2005166 RepID=UPI002AB993AB|nr:N-acetylmuramoyl-L-alanine amidase [Tabrizicola sp.]MDZ4089183.1 N-acetylmuramoyl-L-alanine amidase [Tabrizicola sp.]